MQAFEEKTQEKWILKAVLLGAIFLLATMSRGVELKETNPAKPSIAATPEEDSAEVIPPGDKTPDAKDLTQVSLENLAGMDVMVTSSSKKAESLRDATSAIYVITQEDIRRSGFQHVADLLRMVPGVQVSAQSANEWAISARGFNSQYNNKMLVLVDGRSVYDPILGGVYWNEQDLPLEDIDHIEVIRGPGGALWGSNAVNGIVNIITKDSKATQGYYATYVGGSSLYGLGAARYGDQLADGLYYRVYGQATSHGPDQDPNGGNWHDGWYDFRAGFRSDLHADQDLFTLEGGAQKGYFDYHRVNNSNSPMVDPYTLVSADDINTQVSQNAHLLGKWTRGFQDNSEIQALAYYDYTNLTTLNDARISNSGTAEVEFQHRFGLDSWNEITWGGSYRDIRVEFRNQTNWVYVPQSQTLDIYGGFLQDRVTLVSDKLYLTGGAKLENNPYTGAEFQPSGRFLWTPNSSDSFWGAVSRAVRIPTINANSANIFLYGVPAGPTTFFGGEIPNPNLKSETLVAYELGYRTNPTKNTSLDIAAFYNQYNQLIAFGSPVNDVATPAGGIFTNSFGLPFFQQQNQNDGDIYGVEVSVKWDPANNFHLVLNYTYQDYDQEMVSASNTELGAVPPHNLLNGRITFEPVKGWEINGAVYFSDVTYSYDPNTNFPPAPANVRLDLGSTLKVSDNLEMAFWGQDLDGTDSETLQTYGIASVNVAPSFYGRVTLRY